MVSFRIGIFSLSSSKHQTMKNPADSVTGTFLENRPEVSAGLNSHDSPGIAMTECLESVTGKVTVNITGSYRTLRYLVT